MDIQISNWLYKIGFKIKQKAIYFELKHHIKYQKSYLKRTHYWERSIGKSYSLVKLAVKYNLPIIVPNKMSQQYLQSMSKIKLNLIVASRSLRGMRFNTVLLEEGVEDSIISELIIPASKCVVGYRYIG